MKNELVDTSRVVFGGTAITLKDLFDFNQRLFKPAASFAAHFRAELCSLPRVCRGASRLKQ